MGTVRVSEGAGPMVDVSVDRGEGVLTASRPGVGVVVVRGAARALEQIERALTHG